MGARTFMATGRLSTHRRLSALLPFLSSVEMNSPRRFDEPRQVLILTVDNIEITLHHGVHVVYHPCMHYLKTHPNSPRIGIKKISMETMENINTLICNRDIDSILGIICISQISITFVNMETKWKMFLNERDIPLYEPHHMKSGDLLILGDIECSITIELRSQRMSNIEVASDMDLHEMKTQIIGSQNRKLSINESMVDETFESQNLLASYHSVVNEEVRSNFDGPRVLLKRLKNIPKSPISKETFETPSANAKGTSDDSVYEAPTQVETIMKITPKSSSKEKRTVSNPTVKSPEIAKSNDSFLIPLTPNMYSVLNPKRRSESGVSQNAPAVTTSENHYKCTQELADDLCTQIEREPDDSKYKSPARDYSDILNVDFLNSPERDNTETEADDKPSKSTRSSSSSSKKKNETNNDARSATSKPKKSRKRSNSDVETSDKRTKIASDESNKKTYKIMLTQFDSALSAEYKSIIQKLGGDVVEKDGDVLVTLKISHTFKFLTSVCRGIHIVSPEWLKQSDKNSKFADPSKYLLRDKSGEEKHNCNLKQLITMPKTFLSGWTVFITPSIKPSPLEIEQIIRYNGGNCVCQRIEPRLPVKRLENAFTVSCDEDKEIYTKLPEPYMKADVIMKGVFSQKLDIKRYLLEDTN